MQIPGRDKSDSFACLVRIFFSNILAKNGVRIYKRDLRTKNILGYPCHSAGVLGYRLVI